MHFRLYSLRLIGQSNTPTLSFKRRIMCNAGMENTNVCEASGRAPDGYGSFTFDSPSKYAISRKLPAETVKEAFLQAVHSSREQLVELPFRAHIAVLLRELGDDNHDESLNRVNAYLSLDNFLMKYFEGSGCLSDRETFEGYWCGKYGRRSFTHVLKMGLLKVEEAGVPAMYLLPDRTMDRFQCEGDFVAAEEASKTEAKASCGADEVSKIGAQ
jgi:hypothetical protein